MDWSGPWCYELAKHEYMPLSISMQADKDLCPQVTDAPCLAVQL